MRLRVQHEGGAIETITLVPPVEMRLGKTLNRLVDSSGMEHFFTDDGFYDGWGCQAPPTSDAAIRRIEQVEEAREFSDGE